jgi:acetolactate synthase I/II/III large subunit
MKVHAALAATLTDHDVRTMFGLVGDGNLFFAESFLADEGGRYIAAAHEAGAILMAAGYAYARRQVGVATVQQGPGLANTLGTLYSAVRERAPIVVIAADIPAVRRGHAQKGDQSAMVLPTGAVFDQVRSAQTAPADLARALRTAWAERRPVVFNASAEFSFEDVAYSAGSRTGIVPAQAVAPDPAAMDTAVGVLASANRPIVLGGMGASWSQAAAPLKRLARVLGAPLATTLPAKGLFAGDPYDIGVFGSFSSQRAVEAIMAADCIVAVGASLNEYTGGAPDSPFFQGKRIVQCDTNLAAIGAWYPVDAAVVADAGAFAETAVAWLEEAGHVASSFHAGYSAARPEEPVTGKGSGSGEFVDLSEAMDALNKALPPDRSVVSDGGRFMAAPVKRLDVPKPEQWSFPGRGFGAIGNGLATAIGVACAKPDAPAVAVVGDGGFMLGGLTEFNTAVRHDIDLITVVCNDSSYGAEYDHLKHRGHDVGMSLLSWPDLAPVADALGGSGFTVRTSADLKQLETVIAERDRPLLIDVKLDPATVVA